MILPSGKVDKSMGIHLQKIYRTSASDEVGQVARKDVVTISKFAALVEKGRAAAMSLPDVRQDRVEQARAALAGGDSTDVSAVASAMISAAVEGQG
jgi:anti-sigma28 factor (negative regulator of flagellin synthesis)